MAFVNSYKPPQVTVDISFKNPYDINSLLPVPTQLDSDRVRLVPFIPAVHAAPFHKAYIQDPNLGRYLPVLWEEFDSMLTFIESFIRSSPGSALFAIIDKTRPDADAQSSGSIAGMIGWQNGSMSNLSLEVGPVVILPAFQRTFVGTNAVGLLLKYAFDLPEDGGLAMRRVFWCADPANAASIGAAEKMGFVKEGVLRWMWILPIGKKGKAVDGNRKEGDGRDSAMLSICWDDWEAGVREHVVQRMKRV
ncbi:acyl-CoA N-acyltransferase [Crassisporium funariophilum]|nr:acyl-CoA N-acyltransferase [Crassisporium funariophilum]